MQTPEPATAAETSNDSPGGVMDAGYARDRERAPQLAFRLRERARQAVWAYRRFGPGTAPGPRVLDLGAAEGRTLLEVHRRLGAVASLGIEYAAELVAAAPPLPPGVTLIVGDATRPPPEVEDGAFDLVTALAVLEHLPAPLALFAAARRALGPGGILAATCPLPFWDRASGAAGLHQDAYHHTDFDRRLFERLARQAGLEPVRYRRFMFVGSGVLPYARIPVPEAVADAVDALVRLPRLLDATFVNQLFVARRN